MNTLLAVLLVAVGSASAISFIDLVQEEWNLFKLTHKISYPSDIEEKFRLKIFMDNRHKIVKHNAKYLQGLVPFEIGLNKYADMLHQEIVETMNGYNKSRRLMACCGDHKSRSTHQVASFITPVNVKPADHVNWVDAGAVTPVKDQGRCGSCYSFSATGALEGQHFRQTNKLVSLSEQNVLDCSANYENDGCNGGLPERVFQYVKDNHGIDSEESYPYQGDVEQCRYNAKDSAASDVGFVRIPSGDEDALMRAVATIGPISVAIDASHETFQLYKDGVYLDPECGNSVDDLDHAVLVVGYGHDAQTGLDYWLVKNSWGTTWGIDGYVKIARNKDNQCGIASMAVYPLV